MAKAELKTHVMLTPRGNYNDPLPDGERGVSGLVVTRRRPDGIRVVTSNMNQRTRSDNLPKRPNK